MKKNLRYRIILILVVVVTCSVLLLRENINLGLDLQGGIHMVLQVETNDALEAETEQFRDRVQSDLERDGITFVRTRVSEDQTVEIEGVPDENLAQLQAYLGAYDPNWTYQTRANNGSSNVFLRMSAAYAKDLAGQSVRQAREIIQRRVDAYGVAEPTITVYGSGNVQDQIIVELPGVEDFERVKGLIRSTAMLELKLTHPSNGGPFPSLEAARQAFGGSVPADYEVLPYRERDAAASAPAFLVVRKAATITGQHLKNARRSQDPVSGRAEVVFFLNTEGVRLFSTATEQNQGNRLAIVLDDIVRSAPNIQERIDTESARITGSFTPEQAEDLALTLRSGALPASIRILEERSVGPSLGRDSILRGIYASILGLVLVVMGMLVVYRLSGINAILCLVLNLLMLMGVMAWFNATLTLPGIAGVILTIGMAVDANILIFERVKEEIRLGKSVRAAVEAGFGRVFSTILDTNLTTLVAALFLFQFGTGPVKGFAVTLAVGLIANIFTATFVSRTLFDLLFQRREVASLSI